MARCDFKNLARLGACVPLRSAVRAGFGVSRAGFFSGVPVPGATVTVSQGDKEFTTVTDRQGLYQFADLANGEWKIEIEMSGFSTLDGTVTCAPETPQGKWDLKLLELDKMLAKAQVSKPLRARPVAETQPPKTGARRNLTKRMRPRPAPA